MVKEEGRGLLFLGDSKRSTAEPSRLLAESRGRGDGTDTEKGADDGVRFRLHRLYLLWLLRFGLQPGPRASLAARRTRRLSLLLLF